VNAEETGARRRIRYFIMQILGCYIILWNMNENLTGNPCVPNKCCDGTILTRWLMFARLEFASG
jgi:hypothetical protein